MSTFKGIIVEFPQIRIDYFRTIPGQTPPLACFLSHVHSDHLQGLESLKSPFIYCSPATREILLRLERYPHRMNFNKGILESRKQTYKHLKNLLKTIPLGTPTTIELSPGNEIRVTLFDANHCAGAVMFLIEGQGKAIVYTGDIRSETWWLNSLSRDAILIPYIRGTRKLDKIYLDTSFAAHGHLRKKFPSKAEGIAELLQKVQKYPQTTRFYFHAWTFGYEDVWIALSAFLDSRVHLDRYRWSLYKSLGAAVDGPECREAAPLCGFKLGNHWSNGCLTSDPAVRIHSCENGSSCAVERNPSAVHIIPILTRNPDGREVAEAGVGGGKGDLDQIHELDTGDIGAVGQLMQLCATNLQDSGVLSRVLGLLSSALKDQRTRLSLEEGLSNIDLEDKDMLDGLPLQKLVEVLAGMTTSSARTSESTLRELESPAGDLPRKITFPYSRHSSYEELCEFVATFQPRDVYPCTVDAEAWTPEVSMRSLFGHLCSSHTFSHDQEMMALYEEREQRTCNPKRGHTESQQTESGEESQDSHAHYLSNSKQNVPEEATEDSAAHQGEQPQHARRKSAEAETVSPAPAPPGPIQPPRAASMDNSRPSNNMPRASHLTHLPHTHDFATTALDPPEANRMHCSTLEQRPLTATHRTAAAAAANGKKKQRRKRKKASIRQMAYDAALGLDPAFTWAEFGGLACTRLTPERPSPEL